MKFRKKPVEIEAVQWFPDPKYGYFEGDEYYNKTFGYDEHEVEYTILNVGIQTLEGFMHIKPGDWIITGVKGERYPCKPDIFEMTYENANEEGVKHMVDFKDVYWEMPWGTYKNKKGEKSYPDKPDVEIVFEAKAALALLLINDVIFLNSNWWEKNWPEDAKKTTSLNVNCNDVFAWGCADAETIDYSDIQKVYDFWLKDPVWGPAIFCIIKRKELPQNPVQEAIEKSKIWNFEELTKEHNLRPNWYSSKSMAIAQAKYNKYSEWELANNSTPVPFDKDWWEKGWNRYAAAFPNWSQEEWYKESLNYNPWGEDVTS